MSNLIDLQRLEQSLHSVQQKLSEIAALSYPLGVNLGGTGASDAAGARSNLGITPENIGAANSAHTHSIAQVTDLQANLDNLNSTKTPYGHVHWATEITNGILPIERGGTGNDVGRVMAGRNPGSVIGLYSTCEGYNVEARSDYAHAEGGKTIAGGIYSHAEGWASVAASESDHAEGGETEASGSRSHAEGYLTKATMGYAHAEGVMTTASGWESHAEGNGCVASGSSSHAQNIATIAAGHRQTAMGLYNKPTTDTGSAIVIVGNGTEDSNRLNCFRISSSGVYASGTYRSSGADFAEMFEWEDGNVNQEDRRGRFVILDGELIHLAQPTDDLEEILGIVSANPSVLGDCYDDQYHGAIVTDVFGSPVLQDIIQEDGEIAQNMVTIHPEYDGHRSYDPRSKRPEWDAVGTLGKLIMVDDGSCQVNQFCRPGKDGVATISSERTQYRMMKRIDENHIKVLIR